MDPTQHPVIVVNFDDYSVPLISEAVLGSPNYAMWIVDSPERFSISYRKSNAGAIWMKSLDSAFETKAGKAGHSYGGNVIERVSWGTAVSTAVLDWLQVTPNPPTFANTWWMTYSWEQSLLGASSWLDTRPGAVHMNTSTDFPTTEEDAAGRVWWRCDNNDYLESSSNLTAAMAAGICWMVVRPDTGLNGGHLFGELASPSGPPIYSVAGVSTLNLAASNDPFNQDLRGAKHLVTCRWDNGSGNVWWWIDGIYRGPISPAGSKTWATQPVRIGYHASYGGQARGLYGQIAMVNEFAGPILEADRADVDFQLMQYWGIAAP